MKILISHRENKAFYRKCDKFITGGLYVLLIPMSEREPYKFKGFFQKGRQFSDLLRCYFQGLQTAPKH